LSNCSRSPAYSILEDCRSASMMGRKANRDVLPLLELAEFSAVSPRVPVWVVKRAIRELRPKVVAELQ
jgi:hypothetical protein